MVHHYSYPSVQFDENYTLVQFDENYTLEQFDETICFFKLMGKVRLYRRLFSDVLWLFTMVQCNATWCWVERLRHRRPFQADASKANEGIGSVEEGDGRRSTTVGSKASDGGQAQRR